MNLDKLKVAFEEIKDIKRESIEPLAKNMAYRPTFNIDVHREAVLHRFIDLVGGSINLLEDNFYIPAVVTSRAAQETLAVLVYINIKLKKFIEDKNLAVLLHCMRRLSLGWKGDSEFPEMINVLTCVDSVDKKYNIGFRDHYDLMSESAHPNWSGVMGAYSKADHETYEVSFGLKSERKEGLVTLTDSTLNICALLFSSVQPEYEELINSALDVCFELHENGTLISTFYSAN
ncbi:MAG: hypothetical protein EOO43_23445 [Flavobacterium sp.]|nr:MAG: hypothetical protein EOO43_23445 [Flavobacterium sp.]